MDCTKGGGRAFQAQGSTDTPRGVFPPPNKPYHFQKKQAQADTPTNRSIPCRTVARQKATKTSNEQRGDETTYCRAIGRPKSGRRLCQRRLFHSRVQPQGQRQLCCIKATEAPLALLLRPASPHLPLNKPPHGCTAEEKWQDPARPFVQPGGALLQTKLEQLLPLSTLLDTHFPAERSLLDISSPVLFAATRHTVLPSNIFNGESKNKNTSERTHTNL